MKKILLLVFAVIAVNALWAQESAGKEPLSFIPSVGLPSMKTIPVYNSPLLDMAAINAENAEREDKGELRYIGKLVDANLTLQNSGVWNTLPNGDRVWRLSIKAADALAITLYYDNFFMPAGARTYVFTPDGEETYGPYNSDNNSEYHYFVTSMTHTDECIIEYYEPAAVAGQGIINIGQVAHAYRDVKSRKGLLSPNGGSGSCNVDINCHPEGDDWQDEKHAVVTLLTTASANQSFCTGSLVNNVRQDCTPYILTANHCVSGTSAQGYTQMGFYFNNEKTGCGTGAPTTQIVSGSVFKARAGGNGVQLSDFALLQLTGTIPAAYNPYFVGWDATNTGSPNGVCIHHPSGDVKKISYYTAPLTTTGYSGPGTTHWQANWVTTANGYGITEPGSSGSPLFNNLGQIVGDLSGGPSSCTATDKWDYYGKMSYSWTSGAAATANLKTWLDPDNTGILSVNGTYAPCTGILVQVATPTAASLCAGASITKTINVTISGTGGAVTLSATGLPAGVSASFSPATVPTTGTSTLTLTATAGAAVGTSNITVTGTQGTVTSNATVQLTVVSGLAAAPSLTTPANGTAAVSTSPVLTWATVAGAGSYQIEVATDAGFTNIVATANNIAATTFTVTPALSNTTTYYWHVRTNNGCGSGAYGNAFSFTTGSLSCATANGTGLPINIIDNGTVNNTFTFAGSGTIVDVNVVNITGTHSYTGDLTFTLISPSGTTVVILDGECGSNANFNFGLDDASTNAVVCPLTGGNTFTPANPLSAFNGQNPQGTWTLRITDNAAQDSGILQAWSLNICFINNGTSCLLNATTTHTTACGTGLATATATAQNTTGGAVTYHWSNGQTSQTATGLAAGVYTVTVTNGNCSATATTTIIQSAAVNAATQTTSTVGATCVGVATANVSGGVTPYTYLWSNNLQSANIGGLCAGSYTLTVTDANGCSATATATIAATLGVSITGTNPTCSGGSNGTVSITPAGATTPYTYLWSNGATTQNLTNVPAGSYIVTVTAANGSTATATRTLSQGATVTANSTSTPQYAASPCDGTGTANATGSTAPYSFVWSSGQTTQTGSVSGLCAGSYTVTITSTAGCTATSTFVVANAVGVYTISNLNNFSVAPNPTTDIVNVSLSFERDQKATIDLFAVNGQFIQSQSVECKSIVLPLDLSALPSGVYIVRLSTELGKEFVRVIKQ